MGRTLTFLARLVEEPRWSPPSSPGGPTPLPGTMAIGIDQSTALLIDTAGPTAGEATVIGNSPTNHLYFVTMTGTPPALQPGTTNTLAEPLTWGTPSMHGDLVFTELPSGTASNSTRPRRMLLTRSGSPTAR